MTHIKKQAGELRAALSGGMFTLLALLSGAACAADEHVAFIGCPVMRDMVLPELPCWLAQDGDDLYFVGMQSDIIPPATFYPPQLLHQVLVEGDRTGGEKICGGVALKNVKVSVLPELDLSCNTLLPPEAFSAPKSKRISPPFAQGVRLATDLSADTRPLYGPNRPTLPPPPYDTRSYTIPFAFEDDFVHIDEGFIIRDALWYFQDTKAKKIELDVRRDRVKLSNGKMVEESAQIAQQRAARLQSILKEWGVPASNINTHISSKPASGERKAIIKVYP